MPDASNTPATVVVAFPRANYRSVNDSTRMNSGIRVEDYHLVSVAGNGHIGTHIIHSAAVANYDGGPSPVNAVELNALAAKLAEDFYAWRKASLEVRYESAVPWIADGMHDVEWVHGAGITTAVHRSEWEPDFGELKQAGEFGSSDEPPICGVQAVKIIDGTAIDGKFDGVLLLRDNGAESDAEDEPIWIYDLGGNTTLAVDTQYPAVFRGIELGGPDPQEHRAVYAIRAVAATVSIGGPVAGGTPNTIVYIDNSTNIASSVNLTYNDVTNLFSVTANSYFDIKNSKTFLIDDSVNVFQYVFIDNSINTIAIFNDFVTINNSWLAIDISIVDEVYIWNQTNYYFKVDEFTQFVTIWNSTVTINDGSVFIDISTGDQIFQVWNQTDIYIKIDDSTNIISIWNSTIDIDYGDVLIDISFGGQVFTIWNQTDIYFKIDDSTQIINIWGDTIIIEEGSVKIDILVGQLFQIWDGTDFFIVIDQSTGDITFWNSFVQMNETYWKFTYSAVTFFWVDASDYSILIGKPGKATSDTTGYVYWYSINGRPTGTPATKTGYYSSIWDYDSNRFWWWTGSAWILPCCWVIVKITFADTPKVVKYNELIWVDTTGGPVALELPAPIKNGEIQFKKATTDANAITLSSPISGSIVGPTSITNEGQTYTARSDGTDWYVDETCVCVPKGTDAGDLLVWNGTDAWEVLPIDTDDYVLTADSAQSLGVKWAAGNNDANLHWVRFTKTYADFAASATTNTLTLLTLDPQTYIRDVVIKHSVAFNGGSISDYIIDVGLTPSPAFFISGFNVFSAVNDGNNSTSGSTTFQYASTGLVAKATASSANLDQATAGEVDIWVLISVLP